MAYSDEVLADSPVGYWRLGETSGTTANDSSGNGRNGTYSNVTLGASSLLNTDSGNTAADFANSSANVTISHNSAFDNDGTFTVEAWIKPVSGDLSGFPMIVCKGGVNTSWLLFLNNGAPAFRSELSAGTVTSPTALTAGNIYHIVGRHTGGSPGTITIWVNGVLKNTTSNATTTNNTGSIGIGKDVVDTGTAFAGIIDEVAIYGTDLSQARIETHYSAGASDVPVTGQAITSALGSVSLTGIDVPVSVTGQAITSALGSVSLTGIDVPVSVTGQAITSALGTVIVPQHATANVTGQAITGTLGTVTFGPGVVTKVYVTHTEGVGFSSVLSTSITYPVTITNTLGLADAPTVVRRLSMTLTESLALEGTILAHGTYAVTVVESLAFVVPLSVDADEAWVINLNTKAVTRYESYGFTSFCRRQDKYLGAKGSKIYEITGNADASADVGTYATSGKLDMEGGMMARLFDVFINAEAEYGSFLTFKIVVEDDVEYQYQKRVTNIFPDPLRMKLGKGLRSRFWEFELGHSSSLPSTVESIKLPFEPTKRRI